MSTLSDPSVTKCGHRFCHKCIEECINRRHECPCCKTALNRDDVIVDHSFAALMSEPAIWLGSQSARLRPHCLLIAGSVRDERRKAEREYYQQLVDAGIMYSYSAVILRWTSPNCWSISHTHMCPSKFRWFLWENSLFILATDAPFGGTTDGSRVVESPLESILRSTWT
jgi:hypothetical protein